MRCRDKRGAGHLNCFEKAVTCRSFNDYFSLVDVD
jgi:hypothetical protein